MLRPLSLALLLAAASLALPALAAKPSSRPSVTKRAAKPASATKPPVDPEAPVEAVGLVEGIDVGDYVWMRFKPDGGDSLTFLVARSFKGDPGTLTGKRVKVRYARKKVTIPEAGGLVDEWVVESAEPLAAAPPGPRNTAPQAPPAPGTAPRR